MLTILIPLGIIFCINLLAVILTKKKFGTVMPLSIILICFTIFFSQFIFGTFIIAYWLLALTSIGTIGFAIYIAIRRKNVFKTIVNNYFTTGFFAYLAILATSFVLLHKTNFVDWDDFSHWGPMLKEMLRLDKFYSVADATVPQHKDYPPLAGLFNLLFVRFTGYHESIAMFATRILQLSAILPAIELLKEKSKLKNIAKGIAICIISFMAILFIDRHHIISSTYIDYTMALFTALALYLAIFTKLDKFNIAYILAIVAFLSLIKEITFVFSGIIALVIFTRKILENGWKHFYKYLLLPILICVIALIGFGAWKFIVRDTETDRQFDMKQLSLSTISCVFTRSCPDEWRNETVKKYGFALFTENISNSYIELSMVQELVLVAAIFGIIYHKSKKNKQDKREIILIFLGYYIGALIYLLAMFIIYTCLFDKYEGSRLASFNRYLPTYTLIGLGLAIYYFIHSHTEKKQKYNFFIICCVAFIVQSPAALDKLTPHQVDFQEMNYCGTLNRELKNTEKITLFFHHIEKYNRIRYCTIPNYEKIKARAINDDIKSIKESLTNVDSQYVFIDLTADEMEELSDYTNQKIRNGFIYSPSSSDKI